MPRPDPRPDSLLGNMLPGKGVIWAGEGYYF